MGDDFLRCGGVGAIAEHHRAETQRRYFESALAETTELHCARSRSITFRPSCSKPREGAIGVIRRRWSEVAAKSLAAAGEETAIEESTRALGHMVPNRAQRLRCKPFSGVDHVSAHLDERRP